MSNRPLHKRFRTNSMLFPLVVIMTMLMAPVRAVATDLLPEIKEGAPIDVVMVIDISGSTGGILPSVRGKFWDIQNQMARMKPTPNYRLGIVCMGRPSFGKDNNYVSMLSDLTDDIDAAAHPFFQIIDVTAPGNYFMGHALDVAVNDISWSKDPDAMKIIFLAGNGMPSAGPGIRKPLRQAKENGITIHSLYFLAYSNQTEQAEWKTMAQETGGEFVPIGLKEPDIVFEKSYDGDLLREANHMINTTYVYYGRNGLRRYEMQSQLDEDAELQGENEVEARTFFKATELYQGKSASWDLVDLINTGGDPLKQSTRFMDEKLNELDNDGFLQYLKEKNYERQEYISIIKMLSTKREQFMGKKREKMKRYRFGNTFFGSVNRLMAKAAEEKGYTIEFR